MNIDYDDPEELEICPYDPVHRIRRKRFPYHLVKCRKNHAEQAYKNCPFNARHVLPEIELNYHIRVCPDRSVVERRLEKVDYTQKGNTEVPSYNLDWCKPVVSESWDDDDVVVQPMKIGGPISNGATVQSTPHLNGTTQQNGLLEQKLSSLSVEASQLPIQPGVHQSYSGSLVNGMTQQQHSLTKHHPSGNGVVGGSMPQNGVGRGVRRGRGRGFSAPPSRQPNYPALVVAPTGMGRGIGSFTNSFLGRGTELVEPSVPELPQAVPQHSNDPVRKDLPEHLRDLSDDELRKRARKLNKMLRQIERLEQARDNGEAIDSDQAQKIQRKVDVIEQLEYLKPLNLFPSS